MKAAILSCGVNCYGKKQLFEEILSGASSSVVNNMPEELRVANTFGGGERVRVANSFYKELNTFFEVNGVYADEQQKDSDIRNKARATMFTVKALNSIYVTKKLGEYIDSYFDNPSNEGKFPEGDKEALKAELKQQVEDTIGIKPVSREAQDYVQSLKDGFTAESYEKGLSWVYNINQSLQVSSGMTQLTQSQGYFAEPDDSVVKKIVEGVSNSSAALAGEEKQPERVVREFPVFYKPMDNEVNPTDFVEHFNNSSLSDEEIDWALDVFNTSVADKMNINPDERLNIGVKDVVVDGKPMFTQEQIENGNNKLLTCEVIARALSGEKVTTNPTGEKEYLLSPSIKEIGDKKKTHWYDVIVDFFRSLVGKETTKEKAAKIDEMKAGIEETQSEYKPLAAHREKMTFKDLFGQSNLDKVTPPPSKNQPQKTNTLGKGK